MKNLLVNLINYFPRFKDLMKALENTIHLNMITRQEHIVLSSIVISGICSLFAMGQILLTIKLGVPFQLFFFGALCLILVVSSLVLIACFVVELKEVIRARNELQFDNIVRDLGIFFKDAHEKRKIYNTYLANRNYRS